MRPSHAVLLAFVLATRAVAGNESAPITPKNWRSHPRIAAVRALYTQNEKLQREGRLKSERKEFSCDGPGMETERLALRDESRRIRKYVTRMAGEDSGYRIEYHYDQQGRLRFLFVKGGAVNGSELELRIYFDEGGNRLWEDRRLMKGPGYTFINPWPDELLTRDAEKAFQAPPEPGCELVPPGK